MKIFIEILKSIFVILITAGCSSLKIDRGLATDGEVKQFEKYHCDAIIETRKGMIEFTPIITQNEVLPSRGDDVCESYINGRLRDLCISKKEQMKDLGMWVNYRTGIMFDGKVHAYDHSSIEHLQCKYNLGGSFNKLASPSFQFQPEEVQSNKVLYSDSIR